jgi:hypothetical protein
MSIYESMDLRRLETIAFIITAFCRKSWLNHYSEIQIFGYIAIGVPINPIHLLIALIATSY